MAAISPVPDRRPLFPMIALATVVFLLIAGVFMAAVNERLYAEQKASEAVVQARILAETVTAALAFDDDAAAQEAVDALRANPEIAATAVYRPDGRLAARLTRPGVALPRTVQRQDPVFEANHLVLTLPVSREGGEVLGFVHLRMVLDPPLRRLGRYAGVGVLIGMAAVVLAVLAISQGALGRANAELRRQANDLSETNRRLQQQMEERERAEAALRESQKLEALGRLTGGVAHDFNNLLMAASSGLDLLERTDDPARRARLKAGIRQAMERGASLTSQLLAFSRRSALKPQVVDLRRLIEGMRVLLERSLREDIAVELELPEGLWPVEIDINEFELALINMAVNSRDAMPNGGRLRIAAENLAGDDLDPAAGDRVRLTISDTGPGMSEDTAARAFEPFFTTKSVGKGTGLGLSQVYGFARSSGGDVRLDGRPGEGAVITLLLPRSEKPLSEVEPAAPTADLSRSKGRVLMVEDDDHVATMVSEMLQQLGYRTERAANARAALALLEAGRRFDLVFSDMVMPGEMDGRALAQEIRRREPALPVLLTTGYSEAAAAASADGLRLLLKPYRIDALDAAVRAAMARKRPGGRRSGGEQQATRET